MKIKNTQGIVIRLRPSGETSSIAHIFTLDQGKLILVAKGARGNKSKFRGVLDVFSLLNIHYYEKTDRPYQLLSSAETLNRFNRLKQNPETVLWATVLLEIIEKTQLDHPDTLVYKLLIYILEEMNKTDIPVEYLQWYFILNFLKLNGISYNLEQCSKCGDSLNDAILSGLDGTLLCEKCSQGHSDENAVSASIIEFFRYALDKKIPGLKKVNVDKSVAQKINAVLWYTLGIHFDKLQNMNSVKMLRQLL